MTNLSIFMNKRAGMNEKLRSTRPKKCNQTKNSIYGKAPGKHPEEAQVQK
jgi:hypothetical protein